MSIILHPTFFPNIWSMAAMVQADDLILEQQDNYQKQTYRNRCLIAGANGKINLAVPVHHSHDNRQLYREVEIADDGKWQIHHWRSLSSAYRNSPYFEYYEEMLHPFFQQSYSHIMALNLECISLLNSLLDTDLSYKLSAEYELETTHNDLRHLANARKEAVATNPRYIQVFEDRHGFLPNLSILDLIFNEGPGSLSYLLSMDLSLIGVSKT